MSKEKQRLREALRGMRDAWYDRIEEMITTTTLTYAQIGEELGCSETTVYMVSRLRSLGRYAAKGEEASNG